MRTAKCRNSTQEKRQKQSSEAAKRSLKEASPGAPPATPRKWIKTGESQYLPEPTPVQEGGASSSSAGNQPTSDVPAATAQDEVMTEAFQQALAREELIRPNTTAQTRRADTTAEEAHAFISQTLLGLNAWKEYLRREVCDISSQPFYHVNPCIVMASTMHSDA